ncbi:MAG: hypothetical protein ACI4B5_08060 [Bacteroidaceae bacterium]
MKRFFISLVVVCTLMFNFSTLYTGTPFVQAHAQNSIVSIVSTIISFLSSLMSGESSSSGNEDKTNRGLEAYGTQDCHDELVCYYKDVELEDGTIESQYVGKKEIKFGCIIEIYLGDYDHSERVYFKENTHYEQMACTGAPTTSSCTPYFLSCEEQNP